MRNAVPRDERSAVDLKDPVSRPLKVYAFDPTRGRALGNYPQSEDKCSVTCRRI